MNWLPLILAFIAGTFLPMQAGLNAQLASLLGHPILAAAVAYLIGAIALLFCAGLFYLIGMPLNSVAQVPWYLWLSGLLGSLYITATILLAPILGAATMIGVIVASQMLTSIAIDHFGLVGFPTHPINTWRMIGTMLLIGGVVVIQQT